MAAQPIRLRDVLELQLHEAIASGAPRANSGCAQQLEFPRQMLVINKDTIFRTGSTVAPTSLLLRPVVILWSCRQRREACT